MNCLKDKKILILLLVSTLMLGGCSTNNNKDNDVNKVDYNVVVYGSTTMSDGQIVCHVDENTTADVLTYNLSDDHQSWVSSFGVLNLELNELDYISIKNNYSKNYMYNSVNYDSNEIVDSSIYNALKLSHKMMIYSHGFSVESNDPLYEELETDHPSINGEFIYLDDYQLAYDNEQIIGYQILSDNPIDDAFRQQIKQLTLTDLSSLPSQEEYGYYQIFVITLNFHHNS